MENIDRIISDPNNITMIREAVEEYFESHMAFNTSKNRLTRCNDTDCHLCAFKSDDGETCSQKSLQWLHQESED